MLISIITLIFLSCNSDASVIDKAIYGFDNRIEFYESRDKMLKDLSLGVAAQIYNGSLYDNGTDKIDYSYPNLGDVGLDKLCKNERYANQPAGSNCTGFLIEEDKILTAGHCVKFDSDCSDFKWVFDYKYENAESLKRPFSFNHQQLVKCTKILKRRHSGEEGPDYAILLLDRKIKNRTILKLQMNHKVKSSDEMAVIGFPLGLPMKFSTNATIRKNTQEDVFFIDSDTFYGNSGSPVINHRTGLVEGILVRGEVDFEIDKVNDCRRYKRFLQHEGKGEQVIRVSEIIK